MERLGIGFRFGDGGSVGTDVVWVMVRVLEFVVDSLLVCRAYLSRFGLF